MAEQTFTLRELLPSDSATVTNLITGFEGDLTTCFEVDPYQAIVLGTEYPTTGVVVEAAGVDGLAGMGTVRYSRVQFNGEVLPLAFLDGLKVRPEFRGQGLGTRIARWRIQHARQAFGDSCVIATGMLHTNQASHAVAAKWAREFAESAIVVFVLPMRTQAPKPIPGITVRQVEDGGNEEFASGQNRFYRNYNLYPPTDADSIARALGIAVEGKRPYRYFAAVDKNGNLLAGAQTWARGLLKSDRFRDPPRSLRLLNRFLRLFPADFIMRDVAVNGIWYRPENLHAANYLWEALRWECRDQGSILTASFDARDPARQVATLRPWHQPRPRITFAIHGPAPMDRDKLLFVMGRV